MKIEVRKPSPQEIAAMQQCPVWEKEPSEFPWRYDERETFLVIEGDVTIETEDGSIRIGPGDLVTCPAGLDCVWKVHKRIRKHYKFG